MQCHVAMLYAGLSAEHLAGSAAGHQETTAWLLETAKRLAFLESTPSSILLLAQLEPPLINQHS